jgi:hypothetical protein
MQLPLHKACPRGRAFFTRPAIPTPPSSQGGAWGVGHMHTHRDPSRHPHFEPPLPMSAPPPPQGPISSATTCQRATCANVRLEEADVRPPEAPISPGLRPGIDARDGFVPHVSLSASRSTPRQSRGLIGPPRALGHPACHPATRHRMIPNNYRTVKPATFAITRSHHFIASSSPALPRPHSGQPAANCAGSRARVVHHSSTCSNC